MHLADKLKADGIIVDSKNYDGVNPRVFSIAALVSETKEAQTYAMDQLKKLLVNNIKQIIMIAVASLSIIYYLRKTEERVPFMVPVFFTGKRKVIWALIQPFIKILKLFPLKVIDITDGEHNSISRQSLSAWFNMGWEGR